MEEEFRPIIAENCPSHAPGAGRVPGYEFLGERYQVTEWSLPTGKIRGRAKNRDPLPERYAHRCEPWTRNVEPRRFNKRGGDRGDLLVVSKH